MNTPKSDCCGAEIVPCRNREKLTVLGFSGMAGICIGDCSRCKIHILSSEYERVGDGNIAPKEGSEEKVALCELCGEPMPKGEESLMYHGYSCPCPRPPLPSKEESSYYENLPASQPWESLVYKGEYRGRREGCNVAGDLDATFFTENDVRDIVAAAEQRGVNKYYDAIKVHGVIDDFLAESTIDNWHGKLWSTAVQKCFEAPFVEVAIQHLLSSAVAAAWKEGYEEGYEEGKLEAETGGEIYKQARQDMLEEVEKLREAVIDFLSDEEGKNVGDYPVKDIWGRKPEEEDLDAPLWTEAGLYGRVGKDLARTLLGKREYILSLLASLKTPPEKGRKEE
jgi:hypothetical protein